MGFIYKPLTRKGPVVLSDIEGAPPTITLPNGQVITAVRGDRAGGVYRGHDGFQWVFPRGVTGQQGVILSFNGQQQVLDNSNMSYRGPSLGSLAPSSKGAIGGPVTGGGLTYGRPDTDGIPDAPGFGGGQGDGGFDTDGIPDEPGFVRGGGGYGATPIGPYGFAPADLTGAFPSPFLSGYNPINAAPYKFTDVKKFAKEYGQFNREELNKNFNFSKGLALDTLDTELKSLQGYVPAAAALKRSETSIDNQFNQQQRTQQIDTALPGVRNQLISQGQRADSYANGRIPDAVQDRAFELGVRSNAADVASAGGFGAQSSVARKASDLMSAAERVKLSQYGDQLLGQNVQTRSNLELAPTEYSNAGAQVNVNPPVSYSQLQQGNFGQINQATVMPTTSAFTGQVQQNQFVTGLEQTTRQFNASNTLQNDQFNVGNQNNFALQKFGYQAGLAGAFAGAAQTNLNTGLALDQQAQAAQQFQDYLNQSQQAGTIGSIGKIIGSLLPSLVSGLFSGGGNIGVGDFKLPDFDFGLGLGGDGGDSGFTLPGLGDLDLGSGLGDLDLGSALDFGGLGDLGLGDFSFLSAKEPMVAKKAAMKVATDTSKGVLASAGISNTPAVDMFKVGVDNKGNDVYSSIPLSQSTNTETGSKIVQGLAQLVDPFKVLEGSDKANLHELSLNVSDPNNLNTLNTAVLTKDKKAFVTKALAVTQQPSIESVKTFAKKGGAPADAVKGAASVYAANQLFENWGHMSEAQKSIGLASLGVNGYKTAKGTTLSETPIIRPTKDASGNLATPGLTIGQSLSLMSKGYNPYSVVKNWGELTTMQKVAGVSGGPESIAAFGKSLGLEGSGTTDAAVPNITPQTIQAMGGVPAPQYGIGALQVPAGTKVPVGYQVTGKSNGVQIIAPTANVDSRATSPTGDTQPSTGAASIYAKWDRVSGDYNGATGGSQMSAGLAQLSKTNPYLLGGTIAASTLSNNSLSNTEKATAIRKGIENIVASYVTGGASNVAMAGDKIFLGGAGNELRDTIDKFNPMTQMLDKGVGKVLDIFGGGQNKEHTARDNIRSFFQKAGIVDDDMQFTLADGTKASIGDDGHGGKHSVTNPDQLSDEQKGKIKDLHPYDVDYTNDLDFAAHMGGVTLSRLLTGKSKGAVEQLGNQIGNASLKNVGYNKAFTEENFGKAMQNQRAIYAQSGIKSKQDMLQLANQAFAEKRIDSIQHATAVQSASMIFDNNSFGQAQRLMSGRRAGVQALPKLPVAPVETPEAPKPSRSFTSTFKGPVSNIKATNQFQVKKFTSSIPGWKRNPDGSLATGSV